MVHDFLTGWRTLFKDERGRKQSVDEAQARDDLWQQDELQDLVPLRRARAQVTSDRFVHLSQFLRHPVWELPTSSTQSLPFEGHPRPPLQTAVRRLGLQQQGLQQRPKRGEHPGRHRRPPRADPQGHHDPAYGRRTRRLVHLPNHHRDRHQPDQGDGRRAPARPYQCRLRPQGPGLHASFDAHEHELAITVNNGTVGHDVWGR